IRRNTTPPARAPLARMVRNGALKVSVCIVWRWTVLIGPSLTVRSCQRIPIVPVPSATMPMTKDATAAIFIRNLLLWGAFDDDVHKYYTETRRPKATDPTANDTRDRTHPVGWHRRGRWRRADRRRGLAAAARAGHRALSRLVPGAADALSRGRSVRPH